MCKKQEGDLITRTLPKGSKKMNYLCGPFDEYSGSTDSK